MIVAKPISLNAKYGAVALVVSAPLLTAMLWMHDELPNLAPILFCVFSFGIWALLDELGLERPLNKMAAVAFSVALIAFLFWQMAGNTVDLARVQRFLAFGLVAGFLFVNLALLHRGGSNTKANKIGAIAGSTALIVAIVSHLAMGLTGILGFGLIWADFGSADLMLLRIVMTLVTVWALFLARAMFRGTLGA